MLYFTKDYRLESNEFFSKQSNNIYIVIFWVTRGLTEIFLSYLLLQKTLVHELNLQRDFINLIPSYICVSTLLNLFASCILSEDYLDSLEFFSNGLIKLQACHPASIWTSLFTRPFISSLIYSISFALVVEDVTVDTVGLFYGFSCAVCFFFGLIQTMIMAPNYNVCKINFIVTRENHSDQVSPDPEDVLPNDDDNNKDYEPPTITVNV